MSGPAQALSFGPARDVLTVSALTAEIREKIEGSFQNVRVCGEISNARKYRSGHWYFTLKDEEAQIACVCFRGHARYLRVQPEDGLEVIARGRVGVYPKQGQYQLYVEALEPQGLGALQERFERLKARLQEEGLFDSERKRPLPPLPRRIGIVTSPTGAVIADMLHVLGRRFPGLHVRLFPVRVQGDGSVDEIVEGIRYFSRSGWPEVLIVGRGGGSLEDLWSFNEEAVARAISECSVPVVSAVGHETDVTIADFVADRRAPTPSAAAELVVPEAAAVRQQAMDSESRASKAIRYRLARLGNRLLQTGIDSAAIRMSRRIGNAGQLLDDAEQALRAGQARRLRSARERLELVERALGRQDLRLQLARRSEHLGTLAARLPQALLGILRPRASRLAQLSLRLPPAQRSALDGKSSRLAQAAGRLDSLSPLSVLERGYSIVRAADGTAVRDSSEVALGDPLSVWLRRGKLGVRVEASEKDRREAPRGGSRL